MIAVMKKPQYLEKEDILWMLGRSSTERYLRSSPDYIYPEE